VHRFHRSERAAAVPLKMPACTLLALAATTGANIPN
jgi:hypothetical protein